MLNQKIEEAFNKQINAELFSSYLYLSMAAYCDSLNLTGMSHWMQMQAHEENIHAMKFFDFINERGGRVTLAKIEAPQVEWASPLAAFQGAYEHECKISGMINKLVDLALGERDHAANAFLQWFVTEQVEEESSVLDIAEKLKLTGDNGGMLLMLDRELSQRALPAAPPA
ncbi:MAG: ferritin [Planctomycetota bacterium]